MGHTNRHSALSVMAWSFVCMHRECRIVLASMTWWYIEQWLFVRRVEDYWHGYKLFCYAYYSHSLAHETEFRETKLGSWFS